MTAVRIRKYKISKRGDRGLIVSLPNYLVHDLGLGAGEEVSLYKGIIGGKQVLILANSDDPALIDDISIQSRELAAFVASKKEGER